jgi:hypothetical protein
LTNLCKSVSKYIATNAVTYFTQSFFNTSNNSTSISASGFWLSGKSEGDATDVGDHLRTLQEAAAIGKSGESDGSSDLIVVARDELVGSSAGEGREGRDDNSGETHVE